MAGGYDRMSPRRKVVDEIISNGTSFPTGISGFTAKQFTSRYNSWAAPLPPSSSARVIAVTLSSSTNATSGTVLANPDYPRVVRVAPTTSQSATNTVTVTGTNQWGAAITDTITLASNAIINGVKAFKTISAVSISASTSGTGTQAAVSVTVGLGNVFGLDRTPATVAAVIRGAVNGTAETTAPTISSSNATASFSTSATSSAGGTVEILYYHADITHS